MRNTRYIILAGCLWGVIVLFINCLHGIGFDSMQCAAVRAMFTALISFL